VRLLLLLQVLVGFQHCLACHQLLLQVVLLQVVLLQVVLLLSGGQQQGSGGAASCWPVQLPMGTAGELRAGHMTWTRKQPKTRTYTGTSPVGMAVT
jgi:hypothetical protein